MKHVLLFLSLLLCLNTNFHAQYLVEKVQKNDTCLYFLKNTSSETLYPKRVSMLVFHQKQSLLIEPGTNIFGVEQLQFQGDFIGSTTHYKFKTVQQHPLSDTVQPGKSALILKLVNTGNLLDTVLAARIYLIFNTENNASNQTKEVFINGSICSSLPIFLSSGGNNTGLNHVAFSSLKKESGDCMNKLLVKCFDYITGKEIPVIGLRPNCPAGRLHTTYGYFKDSNVFYSFDMENSTNQKQFDSLISFMKTGDYIALYTATPFSQNAWNSVATSLNLIGISNLNLDTTKGYMNIVGRKNSATPGKISYCQSSHLNCKASLEYSIELGETSHMYDIPSCWESTFSVLQKFSANVSNFPQKSIRFYPNPSSYGWTFECSNSPKLFNVAGQEIMCKVAKSTNGYFIDAIHLAPGLYFAQIDQNIIIKLQLIK